MGLKLKIVLNIACLFKERIDRTIIPISVRSDTHYFLLKKLQALPISRFIHLSQKALSEFNASTYENSPLSILVERIIEAFSEVETVIKQSSSSSKRIFFSPVTKINLEKLREKLVAINEVFNMRPNAVPDVAEKSFIKNPAPRA